MANNTTIPFKMKDIRRSDHFPDNVIDICQSVFHVKLYQPLSLVYGGEMGTENSLKL